VFCLQPAWCCTVYTRQPEAILAAKQANLGLLGLLCAFGDWMPGSGVPNTCLTGAVCSCLPSHPSDCGLSVLRRLPHHSSWSLLTRYPANLRLSHGRRIGLPAWGLDTLSTAALSWFYCPLTITRTTITLNCTLTDFSHHEVQQARHLGCTVFHSH